jgi:hypothetical protein
LRIIQTPMTSASSSLRIAIDGSPSRIAVTAAAAACRLPPSQVTRTCGTWLATSGTNTSALTPGTVAALLRIASARFSNSLPSFS